jgi:protease I
LQEAGAKTTVIAPKSGMIQGRKHDERADKVDVGMTLGKAEAADLDAMLLPGGALNADALRVEKGAQAFAKPMEAGKPIAVIGHGSWLLASAGLVKGHTLTSYHTFKMTSATRPPMGG